ncbi:MAG: hypothetical protein GTO18_20645 [Anaerolineales bacterium]|nr:hypothetical protein [Anaerolineales bacterium]
MRLTSLVTSIILISILLAGCGTPVEEPTPTALPTDTSEPTPEPTTAPIVITTFEDMEGTWFRRDGWLGVDLMLEIFKNGKVSHGIADRPEPRIPDTWFEDGLLYIQETIDDSCSQDQIGVYEVTGVPGEYLVFKLVDDPCDVDRFFEGKWKKTRPDVP